MTARKRTLAAASAALLVVGLGASASAFGKVYVRDSTHEYKLRPHTLYFAYPALLPPFKINKIHRWHGWGNDTTKAHGVLHYNPCKPSCAAGNERHRRAKVKLGNIGHCHGRRVYRRVAITPRGLPKHTHRITCS